MQIEQPEQRMDELELQVDGIEEILPTLATRDELHAAIAASEQRTRAHVSNEIAASEQRTRTHFDVVAESLRHDIRLVAEAVAELSERVR